MSRSVKEQAMRIRLSRWTLEQRLGREPTVSELFAETGLSPKTLCWRSPPQGRWNRCSRLGEWGLCPGAGIVGFALERVLWDYGQEERLVEHFALDKALRKLNQQERMVISLRYYHGD